MTIKIVHHNCPETKIRNFSKQRYTDPQCMTDEWRDLWSKTWLLAGMQSDVQKPGDYFVFDIGREQILITQTSSGAIQGFYNVCQHRGNRLVQDRRGHASNFRCAYHAWTYNIDGELKIVPVEDRFTKPVPCAERSLKPVRTEVWEGFVFICLNEQAPPLLEFLGPVADHLAPYQFGKMTLTEDQTVYHQCNWKAVIDNFSELYHVDFLHPQHKSMVDCCNDTVHLFEHGHTGLAVPGATVNPRFPIPNEPTPAQASQLQSLGLNPTDFNGRVLEIRAAVQARKREVGRSLGYDYSQLRDDQLSDVWQYNLFPNTIFSFSPEHLWILRPRPHPTDPQACYFDKISLVRFADPAIATSTTVISGPGRAESNSGSTDGQRPADYQRPEHDMFDHHAIVDGSKTMTITIDQDIELLGDVQAGMNSQGFDSVWLSEDEMRVQHFHDAWEKLMPAYVS